MKPTIKRSTTTIFRKLISLLGVLVLTLPANWQTAAAKSADSGVQPEPQRRESRCFNNDITTAGYSPATGKVNFVGSRAGEPIPPLSPLPEDATPDEAARAYLTECGSLFGITDQSSELMLTRENHPGDGRSVERYQQLYQGIPVYAGELIVQVNEGNSILSVNGEMLPDIALDINPTVDVESAKQSALKVTARENSVGVEALTISEPELWIYNPSLVMPEAGTTALVWRMEVTPLELAPIRQLVLVDAHSGGVVFSINQVDTAKNRLTYTANNTYTRPGTLVCDESNPTCTGGDTDAVNAHVYSGDTYDFYSTYHSRDSLDNAGMTLISTVHYSYGYCNAFWDGYQMTYGDNTGTTGCFIVADDVVAHEMTHGVTEYESGLIYFGQSGAINESFSDLWGEFVDQTNGKGNDSPAVKWLQGEDTSLGAIRNMQNPPAKSDPDKMTSTYYYAGNYDQGGVHTNSGVNNKAIYLMTDGGSFNGYTITGLGITKVARIYYEAQTNLLTSGASYLDLYNALYQACNNLSYSASDCTQMRNATLATEMNFTGYTISGYVRDSGGNGIEGVLMSGLPDITYTDSSGFYSDTVLTNWSGSVTPFLPGFLFAPAQIDFTYVQANASNQNFVGTSQVVDILLIDNDDNNPNVRSAYTAALDSLGKSYAIFDNSHYGGAVYLPATTLASYEIVIWFSGYSSYYVGPSNNASSELGTWLDGGGCFLLSSQDYNWYWGTTDFARTYLGVDSVVDDVSQTSVTGSGSIFAGLGPYTLSFPGEDFNWSDTVNPKTGAETAFTGNLGSAGVNYELYHTAYLGFPFEAIPNTTGRNAVLSAFLNSCATVSPKPDLTITELYYSPPVLYENDDTHVIVKVENLNATASPAFYLDVYADDSPSGCDDFGQGFTYVEDGLAGNSDTTIAVTIPAGTLAQGTYDIVVYADIDCHIPETNESNNSAGPIEVTVTAPSVSAPGHDDIVSAETVSGVPYADTVDVRGATRAAGDPTPYCTDSPGLASVWYQYTPSVNKEVHLDTFGSDYDTVLSVWSGSPGSLTLVECNDDYDNAGGNYQSALTANLTGGTTYYYLVSQYAWGVPSTASLSAADITLRDDPAAAALSAGNPEKLAPDISAQAGGTLKFNSTTFADVTSTTTHWRYIEGFYANGITTGCGTGPFRYCPLDNVTRAQMAVFLLRAKHGASYVPPPVTGIFADLPVAGKEWMQAWVEQFYREGITTGCGSNPLRFCPEQNVTRAEMAVFVLRATHTPGWTPPSATGIFSDLPVTGKEWMQAWVEEFYRQGITTGCGTNPFRYCPEDPTNRASMAVFIDRAYSFPQLP